MLREGDSQGQNRTTRVGAGFTKGMVRGGTTEGATQVGTNALTAGPVLEGAGTRLRIRVTRPRLVLPGLPLDLSSWKAGAWSAEREAEEEDDL